MKALLKIAAGFILFLLTKDLAAQSLTVKAELDSSAIRIGEQVHLKLSAFFTQPSASPIKWPEIKDTLTSKIEVISKSKIDTQVIATGQKVFTQELVITSFDSGYHPVPPFIFTLKDDTSNYSETDPLLLEVQSISVDTTKAIRDIKGPEDAPFSLKEALPFIIGGLIVVAVVAIIIYFIIRSRKKKLIKTEPVIIRKPDEIALEQIDLLENEKLWQTGKYKEFYIRLSDILRIYTEQRFRISALEQTSDELLKSLRSIVPDEQRSKIRQVLLLSDLVKFAKEHPVITENELSIRNAREYILETRPQPVSQNPSEQ